MRRKKVALMPIHIMGSSEMGVEIRMHQKEVALMPIHIMGSSEMGVEIRVHQNALESVLVCLR